MVLLFSVVFILPLTVVRDVGKLAKFSLLSVLCIPFIVGSVTAQAFFGPAYGRDTELVITFANPGFFPAIGLTS
jgi:hypothetical protein